MSSLSLRLFIVLFSVIAVAFTASTWISQRATATQWRRSLQEEAVRFSDLIQQATHHSMLQHRREDLAQVIRSVAATSGVEGIRIYDKAGRIISSSRRDEVGAKVDMEAEACVSCHRPGSPPGHSPDGEAARTFRSPAGHRVLGLINPIENAPECAGSRCHAPPEDQTVLAVLDVRMSLAAADARLAAARRQAVLAALLTALAAGALAAAFIQRLVRRPVQALINGAQHVAAGDLSTEIPESGHDEIGRLARAFNVMTRDLRQARGELTRWSERLEHRLAEKTEELTRTQKQVTHMEKMASLGKLAATVAHELNNPLAGILNYSKLVDRTLRDPGLSEEDRSEIRRWLQLIQQEAGRSGTIVRNLLSFARRGGSEFSRSHLNPILDRAGMLLRHHTEMSGIELRVEPLSGDDSLECDQDQIQQALVALLVNAVEAMPRGGTLTLSADSSDGRLVLEVKDTGVGIPPDALPHIFEPFYSSKEDSSGAGLGLAVVYGIVQRHGGRIDVDSTPDEGTIFRLALPRRRPRPRDESEEVHHAA